MSNCNINNEYCNPYVKSSNDYSTLEQVLRDDKPLVYWPNGIYNQQSHWHQPNYKYLPKHIYEKNGELRPYPCYEGNCKKKCYDASCVNRCDKHHGDKKCDCHTDECNDCGCTYQNKCKCEKVYFKVKSHPSKCSCNRH